MTEKLNLSFEKNIHSLDNIYNKYGLTLSSNELKYLRTAFEEILKIWFNQINKINNVRAILIAEAPLWNNDGSNSYFYNPNSKFTQFFYKSDLEFVLEHLCQEKITIADKTDFIKKCNEIGLVLLDVSPFPLNGNDTQLNYGKTNKGKSLKISSKLYKKLIEDTLESYFLPKLNHISPKCTSNTCTILYRYKRVENQFHPLLKEHLLQYFTDINVFTIGQQGGGINRNELLKAIKNK